MVKNHNIDRREAVKRMSVAAAMPVAASLGSAARALGLRHPLVPSTGQEPWQPLVFDAHQNETVIALAELIIPQTDTPGASTALVHQYIDFVLSEGPAEERDAFLRGLAWLDRTSRERHGSDFVALESGRQHELLSSLADPDSTEDEIGRRFFETMKRQTVTGYYTSRVGMEIELGFRGNTFLQRFEGCTHPEHLRWEPGRGSDLR
jgi:hypothetical protein